MTRMKDTLAGLMIPERLPETWSGAAVEEVEEERATRLLQRAVKALGCSITEEVRGRERYLVARLLRCKTKISVG